LKEARISRIQRVVDPVKTFQSTNHLRDMFTVCQGLAYNQG